MEAGDGAEETGGVSFAIFDIRIVVGDGGLLLFCFYFCFVFCFHSASSSFFPLDR